MRHHSKTQKTLWPGSCHSCISVMSKHTHTHTVCTYLKSLMLITAGLHGWTTRHYSWTHITIHVLDRRESLKDIYCHVCHWKREMEVLLCCLLLEQYIVKL